MSVHFQTRGVLAGAYLAGAYKGKQLDTRLTHTVKITTGPFSFAETLLCLRVKLEHVADMYANPKGNSEPPTCPTCRRRDPRFNEEDNY